MEDSNNQKLEETRMARANRKQIMANKKINPQSTSATPSGHSKNPRKKKNITIGSDPEERIVYNQDNVKLRFLMRKMLTCSDVGDNGRILIPKMVAEENLPSLSSKEAIDIVMRDVLTNTDWRMKYRFWQNRNGKIYIFDQCGDFVKNNLLEAGDILELYHDEQKKLYFAIQKKERNASESSTTQENVAIMSGETEEEHLIFIALMETLWQ